MYGLVNKAIEDLVISSAGEAVWQRIKSSAGLDDLYLLDTSIYPDETTYQLVTAASETLGQSPEEILHAFGRHWVLYTGRQGWATLFAATGESLIDFLGNLNELHARVHTSMPEAQMPEFHLLEADEGYILEYHSHREGLAPMVDGILSGLAEQFGESWSIELLERSAQHHCHRFQLIQNASSNTQDLQDAA